MIRRICTLVLGLACCLTAQSKRPEDLGIGKVLVTPRNGPDPHFAQAVILIVRYTNGEAVGLMVNRRTTVSISEVLHEIKGASKHPEPVFAGGPVQLETVLALTRASKQPDYGDAVLGDIFLIGARTGLEKALAAPDANGLHVYLGYCGWGPHQLENEVRLGGWYIFDRSQDLAFDSDPSTLWTRMISRTEQQFVRLFVHAWSLATG